MNYKNLRHVKDSEGQDLSLRSTNRPYSYNEDPLVKRSGRRENIANSNKAGKAAGILQRTVNEAFDYAIPLMNLVDPNFNYSDVFLMNDNEETFDSGDCVDFCGHAFGFEEYEELYNHSGGKLIGVVSIPTTSEEAKQALKKMGWTYEQGLSYTMCINFDPFKGLTPQNKKSIDNATRYYKSHPVQDSKRRVKDAFDNNSVTETLTKDFKDALTDMKRQGYHDLKLEGKTFTITWDGKNVRLEENGKVLLQEKTLKYLYEAIAKKYASQLDTRNLGDSKRRVKDDFEEGDTSYDFEFNESDAPEVNEDMEAPVPLNGDNDYDFSYMDDEPDGDRGLYDEDEPFVAERSGFEENDRPGAFEDSDYDTETPQPDDAFDNDTDSFLESISGEGAAAFDSRRSFRDTRFRKIRRY